MDLVAVAYGWLRLLTVGYGWQSTVHSPQFKGQSTKSRVPGALQQDWARSLRLGAVSRGLGVV